VEVLAAVVEVAAADEVLEELVVEEEEEEGDEEGDELEVDEAADDEEDEVVVVVVIRVVDTADELLAVEEAVLADAVPVTPAMVKGGKKLMSLGLESSVIRMVKLGSAARLVGGTQVKVPELGMLSAMKPVSTAPLLQYPENRQSTQSVKRIISEVHPH
jgi:hypothetical protein